MTAIHLLRAGHLTTAVAEQLGRSPRWVGKWRQRYEQAGWAGLQERQCAPRPHGLLFSPAVRQLVIQARSELEAEAAWGSSTSAGGRCVPSCGAARVEALPSVPTIERILHSADLTCRPQPAEPRSRSPHVQPTAPHQLGQISIAPHYLTGGQKVACFNSLDVVSGFPTGQACAQARAQDAAAFCSHFWQTVGIPTYTQVDNQDCFSGGHQHPHVGGPVVRLALTVGTKLVFSPVYHPESNGYVERFHQDYDRHVWQDTYLAHLPAIQSEADRFFANYRQSRHHAALAERTPHEVHHITAPRPLPATFQAPTKRPAADGRGRVRRSARWHDHRVECQLAGAARRSAQRCVGHTRTDSDRCHVGHLDAAPDVAERTCLVRHPFPLQKAVQPRQVALAAVMNTVPAPLPTVTQLATLPLLPTLTQVSAGVHLIGSAVWALLAVLPHPHRRATAAQSIDGP